MDRKPNQILFVCAVWSVSSLGGILTGNDVKCLFADNEDGADCRFIWFIVGHTFQKVRFLTLQLKCRLGNARLSFDMTVLWIILAHMSNKIPAYRKLYARLEVNPSKNTSHFQLRTLQKIGRNTETLGHFYLFIFIFIFYFILFFLFIYLFFFFFFATDNYTEAAPRQSSPFQKKKKKKKTETAV